jgi:hypothetical protein
MKRASATILFAAQIFLLGTSYGCAISVHQRDQRTIDALTATLEERKADVGRAVRVLASAATMTATPEAGEWLARESRNLGALEDGAEARISAAIWYEQQKADQK